MDADASRALRRTPRTPLLGGFRELVMRWARRYVNSHCINIVTYHSVAPGDGPFTVGTGQRHAPAELEAHMAYLRRHYRPMSLSHIVDCLEQDRPLDRAVAVTFDDGFRDSLTCAAPLLRRFGIPMTVFVVTSVVGNHDLMWRHKLTWLIAHGRGRRVFEAFRSELRRVGVDVEEWYRLSSDATPDLFDLTRRYFRPDLTLPLLDDLLRDGGWTATSLARRFRPYLEESDIRDADPQWIEFGNHTHTHPLLAALSTDQQSAEFAAARDRLADWTGRPPLAAAYPFGLRDSYNLQSSAIVRATGHRAALDLRRRLNVGHVSPFDLSRKPAPRGDPAAFERMIDDWHHPGPRSTVHTPAERMLLSRRMFQGIPTAVRIQRTPTQRPPRSLPGSPPILHLPQPADAAARTDGACAPGAQA